MCLVVEIESKIEDSAPLIRHWQKLNRNLIDCDCSAARASERRDKKSYPFRRTRGKLTSPVPLFPSSRNFGIWQKRQTLSASNPTNLRSSVKKKHRSSPAIIHPPKTTNLKKNTRPPDYSPTTTTSAIILRGVQWNDEVDSFKFIVWSAPLKPSSNDIMTHVLRVLRPFFGHYKMTKIRMTNRIALVRTINKMLLTRGHIILCNGHLVDYTISYIFVTCVSKVLFVW